MPNELKINPAEVRTGVELTDELIKLTHRKLMKLIELKHAIVMSTEGLTEYERAIAIEFYKRERATYQKKG